MQMKATRANERQKKEKVELSVHSFTATTFPRFVSLDLRHSLPYIVIETAQQCSKWMLGNYLHQSMQQNPSTAPRIPSLLFSHSHMQWSSLRRLAVANLAVSSVGGSGQGHKGAAG